jgi:DNA adenine methylase
MGCVPFLRWAGGKRWLAKRCGHLLAERLCENNRYIEPFLGSGAMYFAVAPQHALLSDINGELINTFKVIKENADILAQKLLKLSVNAEEYSRVRSWNPRTQLNRAVRFIYLNRTAYGGLYRTNFKGEFNVPYGGGERNARKMIQAGTLNQAATCLRLTDLELYTGDFQVPISLAKDGDIIYCDPTYRAVTRTVYDRYGPNIYSWEDQVRLSKALHEAYKRGALVLVSSQAWSGICDLFPKAGFIEMQRSKGLGPASSHINRKEYLFILDPETDWARWKELGLLRLPKYNHINYIESVTFKHSKQVIDGLSGTISSYLSE